jgi:uncharacterized protein
MPTAIKITVQDLVLRAELFDTPCARAVAGTLPISAQPNEWGDEFYFEIPLACDADATATTTVRVGDIGYWPPGRALAIFFGPTPMSTGAEPVPASEVNIVGRITGDATALRLSKGAGVIRIERLRT